MHPKLFSIGSFSLPTYGFLLACAYLAAVAWASWKAPRRGLLSDDVADLGVAVLLASLVGSKLTLVLLSPSEYLSGEGFIRLLRSGGVFYGGLVAATAFGLWLLHRRKMPLWKTSDLMAPSIALGEAIGRIGCFAAGCCYGHRTDVPWAVVFTDPYTGETIGTPLGVPLHPTQLYLSLDALLIFLFLEWFDRRRHFDGQVFWTFVLLHSLTRAYLEIYRGDAIRGLFLGGSVSTSQIVAALTATVSIAMLIVLSRRRSLPEG
jgi:phosphatidylglycerol:prolipoprotein diacylglycerol transferase